MRHTNTIHICAVQNSHHLPQEVIQEVRRQFDSVEEIKSTIISFKNGEQKPVIETSVRGKDIVLVSTAVDHVDIEVLRLIFYIDALRRSGAAMIKVVLPYFYYERQDKTTDSRESISASVLARMYELAGMSQLFTVHLHNNAIEGFVMVPVDKIGTKKLFWDYLKEHLISRGEVLDPNEWVICSPDEGAVKEGRTFAKKVGTGNAAFSKYRAGPNEIEYMEFYGDVKGKRVLLYDDMIDTGSTAVLAGNRLIEECGAKEVIMAATHPLLNGEASRLLQNSKFTNVFVTDSIHIPTDKKFEKLKVVSLASMLAQIIIKSHAGESIRQENW